MTREFKLPDVGEGVAEGEVVQWLVAVGDQVEEDQPIVEIETDKALVEIPSPVDGSVAGLHAEEGEMVPVGDVLVTFDVAGEEAEDSAGAADSEESGAAETTADATETEPAADESAGGDAARTFAPPHVRRLARELGVTLESVAGSGPGGRVTEGDVRAAAGEDGDGEAAAAAAPDAGESEADGEPDDAEAAATAASAAAASAPQGAADRERTLAAPATRRVARELGVDIDAVPATEERDGEAFVTEEAVRQFAESGGAGEATTGADEAATGTAEAAAAAAGGEGVTAATPTPGQRETAEPYRGLRRTIGERMVESKSEIPHVHSFETVEVSGLVEMRERLKSHAEEQGISLTYMPLILKALVAAMRDFPEMNATLDEENEQIVYKHYYNVGIAVHTEAGLMVPVVENVGEKGLLQVASEMSELAGKARDRSISREEMQGGTITVTNFGAYGGEFGTPIINHPEVAIVGLGRIEERPVVEDGEVVARPTLPLTLGVDHRVIDGGTEAQFRNRLKEYLRDPTLLLLE